MKQIHTLIIAPPGRGKSTLIRRVLENLQRPVFGFLTRKEKDQWDETLGHPIYIYPAGEEPVRSENNLVGHCKDRKPVVYPEAFDRFAPRLWEAAPENAVILMDEIGFMEASSPEFCKGIFHLLEGELPVIAAVKDKDTEFLNRIRSHPKARCFYLTEENRDETVKAVTDHIGRKE